MEDGQFAAISGYLEHGTYPAVCTKSQKFILRRSCKNCKLLKDNLYYKEQIQDGTERDRFVVKKSEATEFLSNAPVKRKTSYTIATA